MNIYHVWNFAIHLMRVGKHGKHDIEKQLMACCMFDVHHVRTADDKPASDGNPTSPSSPGSSSEERWCGFFMKGILRFCTICFYSVGDG